ncbi:MAG: hypothetical protein K6U74_16425, partial [Firmicutes bacterium]|nr:hypothetical protein [Bacillota bacterium]
LDGRMAVRDDDFTMERCFEWFIFDYKLSGGQTVIESFRDELPDSLSKYEANLLVEWCRSRISLYEVESVIPGEGLLVRDLLGKANYLIHDVNAASEINAGSVLLMRVLKVGGEYEFSTSGLALPAECKTPLINRVNKDIQEYFKGRKPDKRGWANYLRERAHKINAMVMEMGISANHYCSACAKKEEPEEFRTIFQVKNWFEILSMLKQSTSFQIIRELEDSSGVFRQATAAWLGEPRQAGSSAAQDDNNAVLAENGAVRGLRPVLAHLILTQQFIIVTAASIGTLAEARKMILNLFGDLAEERLEAYRNRQTRLVDAIVDAVTRKIAPGELERKLNAIHGEAENYSWPEPGYAEVAGRVREGLQARGYTQKQLKGALRLWFDFCSKERPSIRKTAVWAATVIYAFARLEMEEGIKQQELAGQYGIASSSISSRFRMLCKALELVAYDRRYSSKKPPAAGIKENAPLLHEF